MPRRRPAIVVTLALAVALSGCHASSPAAAAPAISLFGTDGNTASGFGQGLVAPSDIGGMAGTASLTPLPAAFKDRVKSVDPSITDFTYAGETYDAVVITALATKLAGTTNPRVVATYINGVTTGKSDSDTCNTIATCFARIAAGQDVAYRGLSVQTGFTDAGEPSTASYGTLRFNESDQIDDAKTEYVSTGDASTASTRTPPAPGPAAAHYTGAAMRIGVLLPKTGQLAGLGKPMFAAARLAINDLDAAGGVLGRPINVTFGDDGTAVDKSVAEAKQMISDGDEAIIGPSTSGATLQVIPIATKAGVIVFSPSATSAALSEVADHGMFFRTAPSDNLQAQALANIILRTGAQRVFIVARNDSYGTGLEQTVSTALATAGVGGSSIRTAEYSTEPNVDNTKAYASIAGTIKAFAPDAVLLIGYSESAGVVAAMAKDGLAFKG